MPKIERFLKPMFLTRQDVKDHKGCLMGMKGRFLTMRKTLKPISIDYLKDGQWIRPHTKTLAANFKEDYEK